MQKYRSYLSKLRKENEVQTFEGMKQQDFSHPPGSFGFQTSTLLHPKDAANCDPEHRDNNMLPNGVDPQSSSTHTVGLGNQVAEKDKKATPSADTSQTILSHPFNYQTWNEIPMEHFRQPPNQDPEQYALLDDDFSHTLQFASENFIQVDPQCSAHTGCLETQVAEKDIADCVMITPLWSQSRSDHGQTVNPVISDAISSFKVSMQNQMVNVNSLNDCEPAQQNLFAVGDSLLGSIVGCASAETIGLLDAGLFYYSDAELLAEPEEAYYCDDLGFEWDLLPELLAEPEEILADSL